MLESLQGFFLHGIGIDGLHTYQMGMPGPVIGVYLFVGFDPVFIDRDGFLPQRIEFGTHLPDEAAVFGGREKDVPFLIGRQGRSGEIAAAQNHRVVFLTPVGQME